MSLQNLVIVIHIIVSLMLLDDIESNPAGSAIEEKGAMEKQNIQTKNLSINAKINLGKKYHKL